MPIYKPKNDVPWELLVWSGLTVTCEVEENCWLNSDPAWLVEPQGFVKVEDLQYGWFFDQDMESVTDLCSWLVHQDVFDSPADVVVYLKSLKHRQRQWELYQLWNNVEFTRTEPAARIRTGVLKALANDDTAHQILEREMT